MNFIYIKDALMKKLKDVDIDYLHIPELGIESEERKNLRAYPIRPVALHVIIPQTKCSIAI